MIKNYLTLMIESLDKSNHLLDEIIACNEEQTRMLKSPDFTFEMFDENVERKGELVEKLIKLDEGFDSVFGKVRPELDTSEGKQLYAKEIQTMQTKIRLMTDKRVSVETSEQRNKKLIEQHFANAKQELKGKGQHSKAVLNYYKNMNRVNYVDPQFLDRKH